MAAIAFIPVPEMGHLLATLKLARQLEARGHHVQYFSLLDFEEPVRSRGLPFVPIFPEQFPKGFLAHVASIASKGGLLPVWGEIRRILALARESTELAIAHGSQVLFQGARPDLVLVDPLLAPAALLCYGSGIPTVLLHTLLPTTRGPLIPPLTSRIIPTQTAWCRMAIACAWRWRFLRQFITRKLFEDDVKMTQRLATASGYPLRDINTATSFMCPALKFPEIILCPRQFDFPRAEDPNRFYVAPSIDFDRSEPDFPWDRLTPGKPILYCSLGSQSHLFPGSRDFLQAVIDMLSQQSAWQGIVSVGPLLSPSQFRVPGENVLLVNVAPQLQVLQRASLMITHGGLSSVKECIYYGVPMLVFPLKRDQPGNAARVVYHGLGVMGNPKRISVEKLRTLVGAVQGSPSIRANIEAMSQEFQRAERLNPGLEIIEGMLGPLS